MRKYFLVFMCSIFLFVGCSEDSEKTQEEIKIANDIDNLVVLVKNDKEFVADIQITIEFYDKEDNIISTIYEHILALEKGDEIPIVIYNEPDDYDDYEVEFSYFESSVKNMSEGLELTEKIDNNIIYGEIKNNNDEIVELVNYSIVYYKNNEIINVIDSIIENIGVGEIGRFEFAIPIDEEYNFIEYDKYEVNINTAYTKVLEEE